MKHFLIIIGVLVLCSFQVAAQFVNQGTLYISSGTPVATNEALTNSGTFTNRGTLVLRSDLTNLAQFDASQGESILAGNTLQTVNSSNALSFQKLTIQNTTNGESIRLNSSVGVTEQLALTAGIIKTNLANPLLLGESAQVTGAGNSAHVVGYVSKTGNTAFIFPIGNGTAYRPAYISPQGLPTMTFSAAYVESPPTTTSRSVCLQALSDKEYWVINGSGSAQVGLPYQNVATSPEITGSLPTLRVARLGSGWEALTCNGNGGIVQGFVLSNGLQLQLGQFTLAKQGLSTQIITQPASASTVCLGGSAAVAVAATGENLGYQWKKDGQLLVGQQSATLALSSISPADAGMYTVDVTGTYGSVTSTGFTLTVSQPVASLVSSGPITCSVTSVTLTATGGDSYTLSDGQTSASGHFLVSTTGFYSVTATTSQGCTATAQTGVNSYVEVPSVSLSNNGPLTCSQSTVTLTTDSYVPNCAAITYAYSGPGLVDSNASYGTTDVTAAGVYSVTLTDAYGCTATAQTTVTANQSAPTANLVGNGALNCTKTNVLLTASGGSSYRFSTGAAQINGGNTATVTAAGVYSVIVTTVDGCTATAQTTITKDTDVPVAILGNDGPLTCTKAIVTLTASGGTSYQFSKGVAEQAENTAIVREAGLYSVTVTAANGCTAVATTTVIGDQLVPTAALSNNGPLTCATTTALLTAGGKGTYRFSSGAIQVENSATAVVNTAGVYSVTVTAANGCSSVAQTTVTTNQVTPSATLSNSGRLSCTNTVVTLMASGNGTYRFSAGATQVKDSNTATVSAAGIYSVTVTAANGCTATAQTTVTSDINVPVATLRNDGPLTCAKPTALLTAGGAGTYRFSAGTTQSDKEYSTASVSTAGVYSVTVTAPNGCFAVAQTTVAADQTTPTATLINSGPLTCTNALVALTASSGISYRFSTDATQLENGSTATVTAAGIYSVTVTAANGCTATAQTTVTGDQIAPMAELSNNGPLTCTNTAVTLTAAGKGSYRFSQGATQAEGGNTATVSAAGVYSVTVTAANGCTATAQTTVKADQTTPSVVLSNSGPLRCNNPTVTLTASGNGTYRFSQGATQLESSNVATVSAAGVYSVTIATTNGCTATGQTTVTKDTDLPVATLGNDGPLTCAKPTVTLVAGGKGAYRFSAGATQPTEESANATVSVAGVYSVTVTAANGCYAVAQTTVEADQILPTVSLINSGPLTCVNAQVTLTATGGKLYQFSAGAAQLAGGNTATVSAAGIYSVTVTAANGCTAVNTTTVIGDQVVPTAELTNNGPLTCDQPTVKLMATGTGSYRFSQGATQIENGNTAIVSTAGIYSVTVTAANGCTATAQTAVKANTNLPVAVLTNSGPLTCAKPTVTLTAGGTGKYRFSAGAVQIDGGNTATVATAGVYSVTVTSENGCATVATTTVELNSEINAPTLTASALITEKQPIQITASGCAGTINWSVQGGTGVANGAIYTLAQPANYTLTAYCKVGTCTSIESTPLQVSIRPGDFAIASVNTVSCVLVNASRGEYSVKFTPVYSGLTGTPVSFSVINEKLPTDAVAPYTLRLYSDNPTITLVAEQAGSGEVRFAYNWRAVCSGNTGENRPPVATGIPTQQLIVNQPYQLDLTAYFADPDGQTLSFYAEGLPTGLSLTGGRISGTPSVTGVSQVTLTAIDPGSLQVSTVVSMNVNPVVTTPTPTPSTFTITGVTTVNCEVISAGERRVTLMPQYSGLNGQPVAFLVKNETAPTTLAGPYTVRLYTDNPVVTLLATQSGATVSYQYSWLAACSTTTPTPNPTPTNVTPVVAIPLASQTATVGQGYSLYISRNTFSDANGDVLTLSVGNLPAGLNFSSSLSAITGTPAQAGESMIQVTATDGGGLSVSTSFRLTIVAPTQTTPTPTPTPSTFGITQVNTVNCEVLSAGERRVSFTPVYSGVSGSPISFSVVNELSSTTAPGPYTLRLYTDNPVITLVAQQGGSLISYRYAWLVGCTSNGRQGVAEGLRPLQVTVLGNPVIGESAEVEIQGVEGQPVQVQLVDLLGYPIHQQRIPQAAGVERLSLPISNRQGVLLLKVSTANQQQQIKLLRP